MSEPLPVLIGDQLLVEVTVTPPAAADAPGGPPAAAPYPPFAVRVVPFTRADIRQYEAKRKALEDKRDEWEGYQAEEFARRIKGWEVRVAPAGPVAEVNRGTVERLPWWAFGQIEDALYLSAGRLLGN